MGEHWVKNMLTAFDKAKHRLLAIDYDGTLMGLMPFPEQAAPDAHYFRSLVP
ncbi:MAG: hypothetical protein R3C68_15680 [Myxococcota bacterium]